MLFAYMPRSCCGTILQLQDKCATLHCVDEDVPTLEEGVAGPCANEVDLATAAHIVILRVHIEEANLLDTRSFVSKVLVVET